MKTRLFEKEDKDIQHAYATIHDFFDAFDLNYARQTVATMLNAATGERVWKKAPPYSLVYYIDTLSSMCEAAFTIIVESAKRTIAIVSVISPVKNGHPDMLLRKYFVSGSKFSTVWNSFPRSLRTKEYINPYKALVKFTRYRTENDWKWILKGCTEYALSKSSLDDAYPEFDILAIRMHLLKLIEACHLLEVRCNMMEDNDGKNIENQNLQQNI